MPYAKEIVDGTFLDHPIPSWLRVFDCRKPEGQEFTKAPWSYKVNGKTVSPSLIGEDLAEMDLGLRTRDGSNATHPEYCNRYGDLRDDDLETQDAIKHMIAAAYKIHDEWVACLTPESALVDCGKVCYKPIAVALCNFGWSVIADRRISRVVAFS
jgi:hypothetical protein